MKCPKTGKIGYASIHKAYLARDKQQKRHEFAAEVYRCPHCNEFHLATNHSKRRKYKQ